ncbi:MAG: SRPBCC family protein [Acidobacteriaceae bacterium]
MSENQVVKDKQSIVVEYDLPDAPEKVWRALTEPKLLEAWLMRNDIRAEVGHRFNFWARPVPGWDGTVYCEVLEVVPQQRLAYSWRGGSRKLEGYGHEIDTVVTWKLTPTGNGGTRLHLEHSGFDPESFAFKTLGQGWRGKVAERITQALAPAA